MKKSLFAVLLSLITLLGTMAWATAKEDSVERLQNAGDVLKEIMDAPDKGIPEEVLDDAKCIVVVPHLIKAGFIVGGKARPRRGQLPHRERLERSRFCFCRWRKLGTADRR